MSMFDANAAAAPRKIPLQKGNEASRRICAEIVHDCVEGRVRFRHAGLIGHKDLAVAVAQRLSRRPGVAEVRANAVTGSVLVNFASPATPRQLAEAINDAVALGGEPAPLSSAVGRSLSAAANVEEPLLDRQWHAITGQDAADQLGACLENGLAPETAERRLSTYGRNELPRVQPRSAIAIFVEQLVSLPVILLAGSAALSIATGGVADAVVIAAVVLLNAGIATATERQAERTILGLSDYAPEPVPVIRGGLRIFVHPAELVCGDLLPVERGVLIPADARLILSNDLSVNESALTGEVVPVQKEAQWVLPADTVLPERRNMLFRGTAVTGGSGVTLVTGTGARTEIGRVQRLIDTLRPPETPMQRQLGEVERELIFMNGLICALVFGIGISRGHGLIQMLRNAIALVVAAIPEGLPAVATTTLALGVQTMRRRGVHIRKLDAVETLGAVEVIGLDKTGTLTENRMATVAIYVDGALLRLEGKRLAHGGQDAAPSAANLARRLLEAAALCNEAIVRAEPKDSQVEGTPTEKALVEAALNLGIDVVALRSAAPVLACVSRSEGRKRMSTLHARGDGRRLLCMKGDPKEVLACCSVMRTANGDAPLDDDARAAILKANERMAGEALRVLGVALSNENMDPRNERDLVWLGLAGLINPVRPSVEPALKQLRRAGVRTVMITGDQSATALAIARKLDLGNGGELRVLEAGDITDLSPETLSALAAQAQVFARVSPVEKLNIVNALQAGGRIVGMTGDGINDGPALRAADISIAMGEDGTDVARDVADVVLGSNDLEGIVRAIRLGRATYANIRKVLRYLISTSISETLVMLGAEIIDGGVAMTSTQLLWLNIAGEPLPALALGLDPPDADLLDQPPHDARAPILSMGDFRSLILEGTVIGLSTLAGYCLAGGARNLARASTIAFHGMTYGQLLHSISCRSENPGFYDKLARSPNPKLAGALLISGAAQAAAQIFPGTRRLLNLAPVGLTEALGIAGVALGGAAVNNLLDYFRRREPALVRAPSASKRH
jgi:Ca2+-transporting ATPase